MTKHDLAELEMCKQTFTITWNGGRCPIIDEPFYRWCQQTRNPYVRICRWRTRADVEMELPFVPGLLDSQGARQFRALCLGIGDSDRENFDKPALSRLPKERASEFAQRLVQIGLGFCQRHQPEEM